MFLCLPCVQTFLRLSLSGQDFGMSFGKSNDDQMNQEL